MHTELRNHQLELLTPQLTKNEAFWGARKPDVLVFATSSLRKTAVIEILRAFEESKKQVPTEISVAGVQFTVNEADLANLQKQIFDVRNGDGELKAPLFLGQLDGVDVWIQPTDGETDSNQSDREAVNKARAVQDLILNNPLFAGRKVWTASTDIVGSSSQWDKTVSEHFPDRQIPEPLGKPINGARRGEFDGIFDVTDPMDPAFVAEYKKKVLGTDALLLHSTGLVIIDETGEEHVIQKDLPHVLIPEDSNFIIPDLEAGLAGAPNQLVLAHAFPAALEQAGRGDGHDDLLALAHINGWPHRMMQELSHEVGRLQMLSIQMKFARSGAGTTGILREGMPLVSPADLRMMMWKDFLLDRPAVRAMDSNIHGIIAAIIGEANEAEEEFGHNGLYSPELHRKELVDILFFIESFAVTVGIELNYDRIMTLYGKVNTGSSIYDNVREISGNLKPTEPYNDQAIARDLEEAYALVFRHMYELKEIQSPYVVLQEVLAKNVRNYPEEYFDGINHQTGDKLEFPEMIRQYIHAVTSLRKIRTATGNDPKGLNPDHHLPFADQINGWQESEDAFTQLEKALAEADFIKSINEVVIYSAT